VEVRKVTINRQIGVFTLCSEMLFSINAKEKPKHIFAAMLLQEQKQLSSVKMGAMTNGVV